ncbi:hypothetical protein M422DRAFT_165898 [Sphaerobolus stellatus SS14]|uniref:F-box domain-containing protein n=1 Tax=Sphaerobolus stellatus (strain SS14) TaxID=990650 RepID=A0A0C9VFM7_SPHS4|nr:hypothetical protein M422DRAFT_165898 [Sphaerobolus stellatus SS14]
MPLTSLPLEILEQVIGNIDKVGNLLALALACRSFSELIIPDHLDYHIIQCPPADEQVWQHLVDNPGLAKRVKKPLE